MLALVPHWARPVLALGVLVAWVLLELVYRAALGDLAWLDRRVEKHLEPQARQAALVLLVGHPRLSGRGPARWTVPLWRLAELRPDEFREPDLLDLLRATGRPYVCFDPPRVRGRLVQHAAEAARAVWIARHWSEERLLDVWATCVAETIEQRCGEQVPDVLSSSDVLHLWAHASGGPPCDRRWIERRWRAGREFVSWHARVERETLRPPATCPRVRPE